MTSVGMPDVRIYVGFNGPTVGAVFTVGDPTLGQVGVVPIGAGDTWADVSPWVRTWSIKRGAATGNAPTLRYDAGTCTVVLNDGDRRFDPENLNGPYVSAGRSQVEPMRRVKIVAVWNGVTYPLFYGLSDDFTPDYDGSFWTTTTLTATDATKLFAGSDRSPGLTVGAGEDSGARISRILDVYGWPAADRIISTGNSYLQSTDLSGNMLAEMLLVQDTEQGELYINTTGKVRFRNRKAMLIAARSTTSQATFGDDPAGYAVSGELPYADVKMATADESLINSINVSRAGGTEQHVEDSTSVLRYLAKSHTRDDLLMQIDDDALSWGEAILYQFGTPGRRFSRIEFNRPRPDVWDVVWPQLLGREFGDRITVRTRPAGWVAGAGMYPSPTTYPSSTTFPGAGGQPVEKACFIRGVEMSSDGASWQTAFVLQDAERYSFFTIGDPLLGRVGYNAISY